MRNTVLRLEPRVWHRLALRVLSGSVNDQWVLTNGQRRHMALVVE